MWLTKLACKVVRELKYKSEWYVIGPEIMCTAIFPPQIDITLISKRSKVKMAMCKQHTCKTRTASE